MNSGELVADTFTGLTVGHAVIIYSGVVVTGMLGVVERDGYIVISNNGVVVVVPVTVILPVTVDVPVTVAVGIIEFDNVFVAVLVFVTEDVGTSEVVNDPVCVPDILDVPLPVYVIEGVEVSERVMETVGALLELMEIVLV